MSPISKLTHLLLTQAVPIKVINFKATLLCPIEAINDQGSRDLKNEFVALKQNMRYITYFWTSFLLESQGLLVTIRDCQTEVIPDAVIVSQVEYHHGC